MCKGLVIYSICSLLSPRMLFLCSFLCVSTGGEDFTVRLWDVISGTLIHTFSIHGGIVRHLLCLPPSSFTRLQLCLCSVADDHSVAILSLKECRCLLMAASHVFPVAGIRWRLPDDFMLVACTDGTVYVWEIETGHLDRCVNGSVAADILLAGQDYHQSGLLDPTGEHASAAVTGEWKSLVCVGFGGVHVLFGDGPAVDETARAFCEFWGKGDGQRCPRSLKKGILFS